MDRCAGCGATFARGEMRCYSQLYAPGGDKILLCQACSDTEEQCVEMCGTNDCPELLATYKLTLPAPVLMSDEVLDPGDTGAPYLGAHERGEE